MKRVIVTGASGWIGRHALPFLLERDFEIHAVANLGSLVPFDTVHWHRADLLDPGQIKEMFDRVRPTHLLHFAWYAEPGKYQMSEQNYAWCRAGIDLLCAFAATGGRRAVFAGTCFEYDFTYGYCSESLTPCRPSTRYGASKLALAQLVTGFPPADVSTAWGRIFHLYGPYEHPKRLVPSVIGSLLRGERARCTDGRQVRDFLHVEDVASAFVALLDSETTGVVNIGSGEPVTLKTMVRKIAQALQAEDKVDFGALPAAPNDPPILIPNVTRLHGDLSWHPRWSLEEGLAATIRWEKERSQCI